MLHAAVQAEELIDGVDCKQEMLFVCRGPIPDPPAPSEPPSPPPPSQPDAPPLALARLTLPVAAGLCGAAHGIALEALIVAYLAGFVANLSSAAVRLGIVGQTDGQRIIAALHPGLAATAEAASRATLDDLGSATLRADLFSLQHETQYSRLFRS